MALYPCLQPWVTLEDDLYLGALLIDRLNDEIISVDNDVARFIKGLDGKTDPYLVPCNLNKEEVEDALDYLEDGFLIRDSRLMLCGIGTAFFTLFTFPRKAINETIPRILSTLLRLLWLPLLVLGVLTMLHTPFPDESGPLVAGYFLGIYGGLLLHEAAHTVLALAYGVIPYEAGIAVMFFLPVAYVMADYHQIHSLGGKMRFFAAGIEMNLALFGICLLVYRAMPGSNLGATLYHVALANLLVALSNLIPCSVVATDAGRILGALLGNGDYLSTAWNNIWRTVVDKKWRRKLADMGPNGAATYLASWLIILMQATFLALILLLIRGVIAWFI